MHGLIIYSRHALLQLYMHVTGGHACMQLFRTIEICVRSHIMCQFLWVARLMVMCVIDLFVDDGGELYSHHYLLRTSRHSFLYTVMFYALYFRPTDIVWLKTLLYLTQEVISGWGPGIIMGLINRMAHVHHFQIVTIDTEATKWKEKKN